MPIHSLKVIKSELQRAGHPELLEMCLTLAKFRKENKEFIDFLLFGRQNISVYTEKLKAHIASGLDIAPRNDAQRLKSIRKLHRELKKRLKFINDNLTEIELLIWFCGKLTEISKSSHFNGAMGNLVKREYKSIIMKIEKLPDDLAFDMHHEAKQLKNSILQKASNVDLFEL